MKICDKKVPSLAKFNALIWINNYLQLLQNEIENSNPKLASSSFKKVILQKYPKILFPILSLLSDEVEGFWRIWLFFFIFFLEVRKAAKNTNQMLLKIMDKTKDSPPSEFMEIMPVIKGMLVVKKSDTAGSALIWMKNLLQIFSHQLLPQIDDVLPILIEKLQDSEDSVIQNVIDVLGNISLHEDYFHLVIEKILENFHSNIDFLNTRMQIVIKKLCTILDSQKLYMAFAEKLLKYEKVSFISSVVQTFDLILLTDNVIKNIIFD